MSLADRYLPLKLSAVAGYRHEFMRETHWQPHRMRLVELHTAGHVSKGDAEPLLNGVRDHMSGVAFGGHGFSLASGFWRLRDLPVHIDDPERIAHLIVRLFRQKVDTSATRGLSEWLGWVCRHPHDHLDWRDRFYIEQRMAGWLSSKEQMYDMTQLERFPILNAARTYALLLSVPQAERTGSQLQKLLIRRTFPPLAEYPFNPPDSSFGFLRLSMSRLSHPSVLAAACLKKILRLRGAWSALRSEFARPVGPWRGKDNKG
jgi:hypothetical protein